MPAPSLILALKLFAMASWFAAAAAFLVPDTTLFGRFGRGLFLLLAIAHTIECAAFYKTLKRTGRPLGLEILNTLFFGIAHFVEAHAIVEAQAIVEARAPAEAAEAPATVDAREDAS